MRVITEAKPAAFAYAPTLAAALALIAGAMLLASGATPSEPSRFIRLLAVAPPLLIEISHFLSSILGLVLVLLAFGLRARLDAAWTATQGVLIAAALLALSKGFNWEESAVLMGAFGVIFPFHGAFPRKARLSRMEITPGWLLSAAAVDPRSPPQPISAARANNVSGLTVIPPPKTEKRCAEVATQPHQK